MKRSLSVALLSLSLATAATAAPPKGKAKDPVAGDDAEKGEKPEKPKKVKVTPDGPCDKKLLGELKATLAKTDLAGWTNTATKGLADACGSAMPKPLADLLEVVHNTPLDERGDLALRAFIDMPQVARAACAKYDEAYPAHLAPGDKLPMLYKDCAWAKAGLMSEKEFTALPDLGAAFLTHPLYTWLLENGMEKGNARRWARAVTTVDAPRPKQDKLPPAPKEPKKK